jgi:hypothetical protein
LSNYSLLERSWIEELRSITRYYILSGRHPHPLIRYMWEVYACNMISKWVGVEPQRRTADVVGSCSREAYNSWNSHKRFKRYKTCKE